MMRINHRFFASSPFYQTYASLIIAVAALYISSLYSYLLFHSLIEIINVVIIMTIFLLAWNARFLLENHYLLFVGISFFSSGVFDLLHLFAYKGFGIFPGYDSNLPTQLWVAFRYQFSLTLLIAPFFLRQRLHIGGALSAMALITAFVLFLIFAGLFPDCYIEGSGLTPFKLASEFLIIFLFLASFILLIRNRSHFNEQVFNLLMLSVLCSIVSEVFFTQYFSVDNFTNLIGHLFLFCSSFFIYRAIVVTGMTKPMALIFRNLEQSEERLRLIAETSIDLIFQLDLAGRLVFCSPAATHYGFNPTEIIGTDFINFIAPENLELARDIFQRVLQGESLQAVELRLKKADGSLYYAEINVSPIVTSHGIVGLQGISRDVDIRRENEKKLQLLTMDLQIANAALHKSKQATLNLMQDALEARAAAEQTNQDLQREMAENKRAEEQIKASLLEKEVLLREIHHRVKNNLQVISSLISLQSDSLNDHRLNDVFGDVRDRVRAMALVHEKLYESGSLSRLNVADYVASLLHYLLRAYGSVAKNIALHLDIAQVELPIVTAVPCGLIINELVSNAIKHAFANSNCGELLVSLQPVPETTRVCLRVRDNGSGLPEGFDWRQSQSLGLRLVHILTRQLQGTVEAESDKGTEFIVTFPVKEETHE